MRKKPDAGNGGVALDGTSDPESLTVRGWQRAGALVGFFTTQPNRRPSVVFAAGAGPGSKTLVGLRLRNKAFPRPVPIVKIAQGETSFMNGASPICPEKCRCADRHVL